MSLTTALNIAQTALSNNSIKTGIVSRNITNANNPDYNRRTASIISLAPGARMVGVERAASDALIRQSLTASSAWKAQTTLLDGLNRLSLNLNGVDANTSPAALIGRLQEALQTYQSSPASISIATDAVASAGDLANALNAGAAAIDVFVAEMNAGIERDVGQLNHLLANFGEANTDVMTATRLGRDASEALDRRDGLLKQIAEIVPVTATTRGDNDMVVVTQDGDVLFEGIARKVSFEAQTPGAAKRVLIDGSVMAAGSGGNTTASGSLAAMLQMRDDIAPRARTQFDEIARALAETFQEPDGTPGLFTAPSGAVTAANITINPAFKADPHLLRDGVGYQQNPGRESGYTGAINRLLDRLQAPLTFDPAAGLMDEGRLGDFATGAVSWIEGLRKDASASSEIKSAMMMRTAEALSNRTGVNIDEELAKLLALEQSYAASAKLLQVANDMMATLLASVR